jgi:hypothetical protein
MKQTQADEQLAESPSAGFEHAREPGARGFALRNTVMPREPDRMSAQQPEKPKKGSDSIPSHSHGRPFMTDTRVSV